MSSTTIRNFVVPVVRLSTEATAAIALQEMDRDTTDYGVIIDRSQRPYGIVMRSQLDVLDTNAQLSCNTPILILEANAPIDFDGLDRLADLAQAIGKPAVLVRDNNEIVGILETFGSQAALPGEAVPGEALELAGNPYTSFLSWACPSCHESYPVLEYRRSDRPRCPKDGTLLLQPD